MLEQADLSAVAIDVAADELSVALLGGFSVSVGLRAIESAAWRLRKAGHLLKLLALAPHYRMHREQVLDTLWPHLDLDAASNNLRVTLHFARRLLDPEPDGGPGAFQMIGDLLALFPNLSIQVDVDRFEEAAQAALRSDDPAAFAAALDLYGGELLPEDRFEQWAIERRESLRSLHLELLRNLARLREERGEFSQAIETLRRALRDDPASEPANVALMRLLARTGQRAHALRQYQQLREALQRELDVEPEPETTRLYEAILTGTFDARQQPTARAASPARRAPAPIQAMPRVPPTNLPEALTSFIGREQELAALHGTLAGARLVTLTGPGGSGKTRLALEVSSALLETCRDGVWLVDLTGLADPSLVSRTAGVALNIKEAAGRPDIEVLMEALAGKQLLLVLDNCEHLVAACAGLADRLLRACPGVRVLATSREPLRVPGEVVRPVPALAVPDPERLPALDELREIEAVRLFIERARLHSPNLSLDAGNAAAIAAICQRLDGMPLAIELAAARVRSLPVGQIAARLDDALPLLTGGSRSGPVHQRSLRATIEWSYCLLDEPERRLFARLAVFAGGFTIEAAGAVWADADTSSNQALEWLFVLVDKSLVIVQENAGEVRYRLLEPIRQYASERLDAAGETSAVRALHARHYLRLAERAEPLLFGPEQAIWLDRLEEEHDNLRAALGSTVACRDVESALRMTHALWRFWHLRGHLDDGRRWLQETLAIDEARTPSLPLAGTLFGAGRLALFQGDIDTARLSLEACLAIAVEIGDLDHEAGALTQLGHCAFREGDYDHARARYAASLLLRKRFGVPWFIAISLSGLARVAVAQFEYAEAHGLFEEALCILRQAGDGAEYARSMNWRAMLSEYERDFAGARLLYEENHARSSAVGDRQGTADAILGLGFVALAASEPIVARARFVESLTILQQLGSRRGIADSLEGLAQLAVIEGQPEHTLRLAAAASSLRVAAGEPPLPQRRAQLERALETAAGLLDACQRSNAQTSGQTLTLAQAVAEALVGQPSHL